MTAADKVTVAQFERQYGCQKPHFEFWHGEVIQKAAPTWLHGLLQRILMELLSEAGYKTGSEVKLKIDPQFQPVPDIISTRGRIELPYPTTALEIVVEILSEDDAMSRVLQKCRAYQSWGFQDIYIVDAEARVLFRWAGQRLEELDTLASTPVGRIWSRLDEQLG